MLFRVHQHITGWQRQNDSSKWAAVFCLQYCVAVLYDLGEDSEAVQ